MTMLPLRSTLFPYTTLFRSFLGVCELIVFQLVGKVFEPRLKRRRNRVRIIGVATLNYQTTGLLSIRAEDRKSTRLNSSHQIISYAVFCLKKKTRAVLGFGER